MKNQKNIVAIISVTCISFLGIMTETSLNVAFPRLMNEFKVPLNIIQWLTTAYLLFIAILMMCSSYFSKAFSAREIFISSATLFILGSIVSLLAPNFFILLIGRLLSSFGAGLCSPLMFNLIVELMPQDKWGFYLGLSGLVLSLAPALGPAYGGLMVEYFSWREIFLFTGIFALLIMLTGINTVEKYYPKEKIKFAWLSFLSLSAILILLNLFLNQLSINLAVLLLISIFIFLIIYKKDRNRLFDFRIFKIRSFSLAFISYLLLQMMTIGIEFLLPNYMQLVNHLSPLNSALILLPRSIIASLLNPIFGRMYDDWNAKIPLYAGIVFILISCILFSVFADGMTMALGTIFFIVFMLGRQMAFNNTLAEAMGYQKKEFRTDATAVLQTGQQYAGSIGTILLSLIISLVQSNQSNSHLAIAQGSRIDFMILGLISACVIICYFFMFKLKNKKLLSTEL
ncbi:MFS transporter [Lactobacillus hominis]|uniref:Multi-drug-type permease n=1 Tax=Lactobacillus hominis DSM 23910 = CRBIP 24.179 TaxID=1423758 RepID=I7KH72_9LACO|nr:MFS transporter [Lactobacillus hominis]KRM85611.1 multi-drug-type permease [Lactobacillus hominis DSM 23910 = CRBIP 24.179]MCT3347331.1 MFS transporter [Lactobacillus hominis]CCI81870.1 Multi-drug-type permease [Lactobacillus hominis DSM 23910 = CRBIP 24.179]